MEIKFSNVWQSLVSNLNFMGVTKKVLFEIQVYQSSQIDISTLVDDSSPSLGMKVGGGHPQLGGSLLSNQPLFLEGLQLVSKT